MNTQPQVLDIESPDNVKISKVLLLNIYKSSENTISTTTLYNLFSPYGKVQKILIFEKLAMQKAFIEFKNMESAIQAKLMLDNQMVNNALIKIYFSKQQQLSLKKNGQNAIDYSQTDFELIDQNKNLQSSIQNSVESTSCSDDSLSQNAQQQFISELSNDAFYPQTFQQQRTQKFQNQNQQMMMMDDTTNFLNMNLNQNFLSYTNNENMNLKPSFVNNIFLNNMNNNTVQPEVSFTDELISQLNNMKKSQVQNTNYSLFGTTSTSSNKSSPQERSREVSIATSGDEYSPLKLLTPTKQIQNFSLQQQQSIFPDYKQSQQFTDDNLLFNKFQSMNLNDNQVQQQQNNFFQQQQQNLQIQNTQFQIDFELDQFNLLQQQSQLQQQQQTTSFNSDYKSAVLIIKNLEQSQQQQLNAKLIYVIFSNFGNIRLLQYLLRKQEILLEFENQQQACCAKNFIANYEIGGCKLSIEFYNQQNIPSKIQTYDEIFIYGNQKEFRFDGKTDLNKLNPPSATLHVSNISPSAYDISVLYNIFQQYGKIENIKLYQKNNRNMSFIKFQTVKDSFNAMGLHGEEYFGRKFHISFTRMKI